MLQLILHLIGDYLTQSDWMAQNKTKRSLPCLIHCILYSAPFFIIASWQAVLAIFATHFLIDRFRFARCVVWLKNFTLCPDGHSFEVALDEEGYAQGTPEFLKTVLLIVADNTLHLAINYLAIRFL